MKNFKNNPQLETLLQTVSAKLGMPTEQLRQDLQSGKFDSAIAGMRPQDAEKFRQILANPQKLDQIMNSKQAKALYEKLTGNH
ncbi:MAG TPA: hypothetical protein DCG49_03040 [Ruminococcus sp.]|nr:hypothetical protein [Ruminococcus sp.]